MSEISITPLLQWKQEDRDKWSPFSLQQFNFCHTRICKTKTWELISSPCTKTTLEDLMEACLKHDNYAASSPALPFFMPHYLVHPFSPELFSLDNPYLSPCCLTAISISHCHTLHHSSLLYLPPTLLPLLSEAPETRRWLLYTMAPVFALLFTCLQTALTTFAEAQRPPIHRGPFVPLYIVHT